MSIQRRYNNIYSKTTIFFKAQSANDFYLGAPRDEASAIAFLRRSRSACGVAYSNGLALIMI